MRIAVKSSLVPPDNPFAAAKNVNERLVWAYGLRNPFRFTFDRSSGKLIIGDVGLSSREEINISSGGENFGWPHWEGSLPGPERHCGGKKSVKPVWEVAYKPKSSIIAGPIYRGANFPPKYEGVIFFADYFQGYLRAIRQSQGKWELISPLKLPNGDFGSELATPSELIPGPDGSLYYTVHWKGEIHKIIYDSTTVRGKMKKLA